MAELTLVSPLLSNMEVVEEVSAHGGTSVYIVKSTKSGQTYILKHISVPESQKQVDALKFTGAAETDEDAQKYYEQVVAEYQQELETMESLAESPNLEAFRSYQIEPKEDAIGFDVYLLAEHRKTLADYLADNAMTHLCAVNLAMDLANALGDLREAGLIHRDVRPTNVYLNPQGHFVLGDLGLARIEGLKYCSMPESMLSSYSAPELFDLVGTLQETDDIYSVGLILYRIYNGNHGPFEDEKTSAKAADKRRVTGETLPAPMYADYEMATIILKACAFDPDDRYQTPADLKEALVDYMKRNEATDTLIVPPINGEIETVDPDVEEEIEPVQFADSEELPDDFKESFSPDTQMLNDIIESLHEDPDEDDETRSASLEPSDDEDVPLEEAAPKRRKRKKKWVPILISALVVLLAAAALVYFFFFAPKTLKIDNIEVVDRGADSITVMVSSELPSGSFGVICTDAYGNTNRMSYVAGSETVFTGLASGTQYTISVEPPADEKLTGNYSVLASTVTQTEILSFTATPVSVTQAELNLIIQDGPDPGSWTLRFYADGVESVETTFAGHSTTIGNLESDREYTFELLAPEGTELIGQTSVPFSTVPTVDIDEIKVALSSTSALLSWSITGTEPESWTVTITGPDDYSDTQVVNAPSIAFEELRSGETYEVLISAPTMLYNYSTKITPSVTKLKSFTMEEDGENGKLLFSWEPEVELVDDTWKLTVTMQGSNTVEPIEIECDATEESCEVAMDKLLPASTYDIALSLGSGEKLEGENTATYTTADPEPFTEYGTKDFYLGLYLKPSGDSWTYLNLSTPRTEFKTAETVAFALQSIQNTEDSDDSVELLYLLRDADGNLVDLTRGNIVWNESWDKNMFAGAFPRTPEKPGTYVLQIFFNGKFVAEKDFKVKE